MPGAVSLLTGGFPHRRGSGGKLTWRHPREYRGVIGVISRATPPFGSSRQWTPRLKSSGHGTNRPDQGPRTARLPAAATTDAAVSDREMTLPVPNSGRESTLAGSVARWVIGPKCAQLWTRAYVTDWRRPAAGPLSARPRARGTPSAWGGGWRSPPLRTIPAQEAMSRHRLRRGSRRPDPMCGPTTSSESEDGNE